MMPDFRFSSLYSCHHAINNGMMRALAYRIPKKTMFELLRDQPVFLTISATVFGLLIGSFLNVVIHRLPRMMQAEWDRHHAESQGLEIPPSAQYNLIVPRSACPTCGHSITAWENIPVISYLVLRGKCSACKTPISPRYPLIELLSGTLSGLIAWHFGFGGTTVAALLFTYALIALTFIDLDTFLLPDDITLPLLWGGLLFNLNHGFTDLHAAVIGAAAGYLSLWSVYHLFKLVTGKEGMGYGDFKLLAAIGAWFGWQPLPAVILLSSLIGAVIGIGMMLLSGHQRDMPIPFGPYLALAGIATLFWGLQLTHLYLP
jgi:leader peptidase (prepilin peptidase)/N-methyltransferase